MKNKFKIVIAVTCACIILVALSFGVGVVGLEFKKFFMPKSQNIERKVFEQTQSYVHGKTQDLAKYYEEYQKSDFDDREAVAALIKMNFADFESTQIRSPKLQQFLIEVRGY